MHGDALAYDRLLELVEHELRGRATRLGALLLLIAGAVSRGRGVALEHFLVDLLGGLLALELVVHLRGLLECGAVRGANLGE